MFDLKDTVPDAIRRHEIPLDDDAAARVLGWALEAQKHGQKTNLIGTMDARRIAAELVADSLMILRILEDTPARIVDIGAGAGVPGLILCAGLNAEGVLVEPRLKRTMFLRHCARTIGLGTKVRAYESRIEDLPEGALVHDQPQLWVSRAVFAPAEWLRVAASYAAVGDQIALWHNGHLDFNVLDVPADQLKPLRRITYSIAGPGDRTIFLFERIEG